MNLSNLRILNNELLNKDSNVVPEQAPIIILDRNLDISMDMNGNETKHIRHISRGINLVRNG